MLLCICADNVIISQAAFMLDPGFRVGEARKPTSLYMSVIQQRRVFKSFVSFLSAWTSNSHHIRYSEADFCTLNGTTA